MNLRTGELRPATPDDLVTKAIPVTYNPKATCPRWDAFIDRIMDSNADLIGYLQRLAGLLLTGDITVQELFIFHGGGANGKSVFIDTLGAMLGDYAGVAPDGFLTIRSHDEHPTEIADLCGKRLVVASETEEGSRLRTQLVKRLTGDARLKARFMRQDYFEFDRTHKLVLVTNNKPRINESTNAIWRRIRLIPFTVTIPPEEQDPHLLERLKAEWPGILSWAVRGCLEWQREGMNPPGEVLIASEEYRAESDPLADFITDFCIRGTAEVRVVRGDLFASYQSWCVQVGEKHGMDQKAFYERIRRVAGVDDCRWKRGGVVVRGFSGIGMAAVEGVQNGGVR